MQWPADDSMDTPPSGMRALPRTPLEEMDTPPRGIPMQRGPMARQQPPRPAQRAGSGDRMWVHFVWEAVLLLGVVVAALVAAAAGPSGAFSSESNLRNLAMQAAVLGLMATGLSLSLRVAAPNLAVGGIAAFAGTVAVWLANEQDMAYGGAAALAVLIAAGIGIALSIVVVGLHVPAWAATLGAAIALTGGALAIFNGQVAVLADNPDVIDLAWVWFAVFVVLSVAGGALWAVPAVRDRLAGTRATADPASRPGVAAGLGAAFGLVGSSVLAAVAGVLLVGALATSTVNNDNLFAALAAVLLGGVSAFGRRGGVFGTVLAVLVLVLVQHAIVVSDGERWTISVAIGVAILVGLVVTRLLELLGRGSRRA